MTGFNTCIPGEPDFKHLMFKFISRIGTDDTWPVEETLSNRFPFFIITFYILSRFNIKLKWKFNIKRQRTIKPKQPPVLRPTAVWFFTYLTTSAAILRPATFWTLWRCHDCARFLKENKPTNIFFRVNYIRVKSV